MSEATMELRMGEGALYTSKGDINYIEVVRMMGVVMELSRKNLIRSCAGKNFNLVNLSGKDLSEEARAVDERFVIFHMRHQQKFCDDNFIYQGFDSVERKYSDMACYSTHHFFNTTLPEMCATKGDYFHTPYGLRTELLNHMIPSETIAGQIKTTMSELCLMPPTFAGYTDKARKVNLDAMRYSAKDKTLWRSSLVFFDKNANVRAGEGIMGTHPFFMASPIYNLDENPLYGAAHFDGVSLFVMQRYMKKYWQLKRISPWDTNVIDVAQMVPEVDLDELRSVKNYFIDSFMLPVALKYGAIDAIYGEYNKFAKYAHAAGDAKLKARFFPPQSIEVNCLFMYSMNEATKKIFDTIDEIKDERARLNRMKNGFSLGAGDEISAADFEDPKDEEEEEKELKPIPLYRQNAYIENRIQYLLAESEKTANHLELGDIANETENDEEDGEGVNAAGGHVGMKRRYETRHAKEDSTSKRQRK